MKKIVILGSTGSIGESTIRVVEKLSSHFQIVGLAVRENSKRVLEQAEQFNVPHVAVADEAQAEACAKSAPSSVTVHSGASGVEELAGLKDVDIVLCAMVGLAGLRPVMAALENGTDVALATKEVLVGAGGIVAEACARTGAQILPVDSEHSAIFQCLEKVSRVEGRGDDVKRIILTASGGPFMDKPDVDLDKVTVEQALNHPRWSMGKKVTIDSATLMNKGLEIMEAHWLFGLPVDKIDVIIHPESIIHSMVEFVDGNVIAQMSVPDMRFAIQYALTYPDRVDGDLPGLDFVKTGSLNFVKPDTDRFPCLQLARKAADCGGTMPAVLNAANEVAVQMFLDGDIPFSGIWRMVEGVMDKHEVIDDPDIEKVVEVDQWARQEAGKGN